MLKIRTLFFTAMLVFGSVHAGSYELFFQAVKVDNDRKIIELLQRGLDPNIIEAERGDTGLILALREGSMDVVAALLSSPQIDLEAKASNGDNALMIAAFKANLPAVRLLLARGAQVNREGWTPLHYAAASGNVDILGLLLDKRAIVDSFSPNKTTPLMMAARGGHLESVQLLLNAGADPTLMNDKGFTPIEMAKLFNNQTIVDALNQRIKKREQTPKSTSN